MVFQVKVAANGRVCIPADVRARLGLKDGDSLLLDETTDGLVLRTREQAINNAQAITRRILGDKVGMSVDDFIAEKRLEVEREEEKYSGLHGRHGS